MGMEPFVAADDNAFGHLIGSIPDPIKNLREALAFKSGLDQQRAQTARFEEDAQAKAQEISRAQMFQRDLQAVQNKPDADAVSSLIMKYPEFADKIKSGWDVKDNASKQADLTQLGEVYSAAASGNWSLALKQAQARVDADKAAGKADPEDQAFVDQITAAEGGDENARKGVLTTLGTHIAAVSGSEHFATVYGALKGGYTLDQGAARYDDNGTMVAHSPFIKDADGNIRLWNDTKNPPPASGTVPAPAAGGFDNAVHTVLGNEGGYNPSDLNGSPTMRGINWKANAAALTKMGFTPSTFKNLTDDQAKQIYKGYWDQSGAADLPSNMQTPYFDVYIRSPRVAKGALAQSKGDPGAFMQLTDAYFGKLAKNNPAAQKYATAWSNRDRQNRAIAMGRADPQVAAPADHAAATEAGQYPIVIPGNSPDQYHTLTPQEIKARGLDSSQQYQLNTKTGQVTGLGKVEADGGDVLTKYNIAPGETGPSVLAKLPANIASQVKALSDGRLPMPSSFALSKPYWQTMLQLTAQYDPTFDAANAPARKAAITAFTGNGKAAQIIGSVNRVANHLDLLANESKRLAGPDTGIGPLNSVLAVTGQAFEPQDAKAYDTEVTFVAGELGKIAKAGVVTEGEVDKIIGNLGRKNSSSTREAAIKAAVGIISGAVDPLKDQYNSAFTNGSTRPNIPWVSPRAQKIYKNIGGVDMSLTDASADTNASGSGASGKSVVRTGRDKSGRRVVQYSDGSISYAP